MPETPPSNPRGVSRPRGHRTCCLSGLGRLSAFSGSRFSGTRGCWPFATGILPRKWIYLGGTEDCNLGLQATAETVWSAWVRSFPSPRLVRCFLDGAFDEQAVSQKCNVTAFMIIAFGISSRGPLPEVAEVGSPSPGSGHPSVPAVGMFLLREEPGVRFPTRGLGVRPDAPARPAPGCQARRPPGGQPHTSLALAKQQTSCGPPPPGRPPASRLALPTPWGFLRPLTSSP
ncbi:uncharacterized protein LOC123593035 isoform X1 [Leopardus geoffroyi]|nr:uncharacterized protein LOC123593035 isoform X1 [Leopardus geoffroyi]